MPVPTIEKIKCTLEEFDSIFYDYSSLTELQKKDQFENNYKGKIITWDGYVERVYEGWTGDYCIWMRSSNTVEGNAANASASTSNIWGNALANNIEIEMISHDRVTDGHFTVESKCRLQFHHNSIWFAELDCDGDDSNYNKNHFFGYLKLQELGYELPDKPQW